MIYHEGIWKHSMIFSRFKARLPEPREALPGRRAPIPTADRHFVSGRALKPPYRDGCEQILVGMGCFWGAELRYWELPGVEVTAVGYAGGVTPNPTYDEVCTGRTGHNEVVLVVYDPQLIALPSLLETFWEAHNPTQGMRQGHDVGTQYRSGLYLAPDQLASAVNSREHYQRQLDKAGLSSITTEIVEMPTFYFAEAYHQQYLAKNPEGYCGLGGTGVPYR